MERPLFSSKYSAILVSQELSKRFGKLLTGYFREVSDITVEELVE